MEMIFIKINFIIEKQKQKQAKTLNYKIYFRWFLQ